MKVISNNISAPESKQQIFKTVVSNAISAFSFGILQYGLGFMLLKATHSPLSFGMNLIISPLVSWIFFVPIGNFIDTHNHRNILLWCYALRLFGFVFLAISLPLFSGQGLLIPVAIFMVIDSFLVNVRYTAYSAAVRELVNPDYIKRLSSLNTACASAARILSPVVGVTLYSLISINGLILIESVVTLVALYLIATLHFYLVNNKSNGTKQSQLTQFKKTLSYMKTRPFIRDTIVSEVVVNFFYTAIVTGIPFIIVDELKMSNQTVSIVETGFSVGYLLGSLLIGIISKKYFALKIIITLLLIGSGIAGIGVIFSLVSDQWLLGITGFLVATLIDVCFAVYDLAIEIRLQSTVDTKILGRVSSTLYTASYGIMPIGTVVYTFLFGVFPHGSVIFVISGGLLLIYTFLSIKMFRRDIKNDDQFIKNNSLM